MAGNISGLVADPQFRQLSPAEQRQALTGVTGDPTFNSLSDDDLGSFISKVNGPPAPTIPSAIANASQPAGAPSSVQMETSTLGSLAPIADKTAQTASDVFQGIGEGALHTAATIGKITDPITRRFASPQAMSTSDANIKRLTTPSDTTQSVARSGEQIGEFFLPTGLEEQAATGVASWFPRLAKYLRPAARIGAGAVDAGLKNKAQGGEFTTGAEAGAAGGVLGEGLQAVAPKIAETALGVTPKLRSPGRAIGQAVLDETSGLRPSAIAASARDVLSNLNQQLETAAANSSNVASTQPALQVILDEAQKAAQKNAGPTLEKLNQLWDQLTKEYSSGQPIPTDLSPSRILALKRGVADLVNSWSPAERTTFDYVRKRVVGALDSELDRTVPEAADLNQRMSSLIPGQKRAAIETNKAPFVQRVLGRTKAHTGALVGAAVGYREGGVPGALAGLIGPEVIAEPTVQMALARLAHTGAIPKLATGSALQADRPKTLGQKAADYVQQTIPGYFEKGNSQ